MYLLDTVTSRANAQIRIRIRASELAKFPAGTVFPRVRHIQIDSPNEFFASKWASDVALFPELRILTLLSPSSHKLPLALSEKVQQVRSYWIAQKLPSFGFMTNRDAAARVDPAAAAEQFFASSGVLLTKAMFSTKASVLGRLAITDAIECNRFQTALEWLECFFASPCTQASAAAVEIYSVIWNSSALTAEFAAAAVAAADDVARRFVLDAPEHSCVLLAFALELCHAYGFDSKQEVRLTALLAALERCQCRIGPVVELQLSFTLSLLLQPTGTNPSRFPSYFTLNSTFKGTPLWYHAAVASSPHPLLAIASHPLFDPDDPINAYPENDLSPLQVIVCSPEIRPEQLVTAGEWIYEKTALPLTKRYKLRSEPSLHASLGIIRSYILNGFFRSICAKWTDLIPINQFRTIMDLETYLLVRGWANAVDKAGIPRPDAATVIEQLWHTAAASSRTIEELEERVEAIIATEPSFETPQSIIDLVERGALPFRLMAHSLLTIEEIKSVLVKYVKQKSKCRVQ